MSTEKCNDHTINPIENLARFPLFRILRAEDGFVSCECGNPKCAEGPRPRVGKHPRISRWQQTPPGAQLEGPEGCGYGMPMGETYGVFAIDTDRKTDAKTGEFIDGEASFVAMGELPRTRTTKTPTGGFHRMFRHPGGYLKSSGNELALGVDVRADGSFIVAPGSPHANGGTYEIVDDSPVADAPEWLIAAIVATEKKKHADAPSVVTPIDLDTEEGRRRVALGIEHAKTAAPAIEGQGGSTHTFNVCMHLTRRLELPADIVYELLEEHWNHRCVPPWSEDDLRRKVDQAITEGTIPCGVLPQACHDALDDLSRRMKAATAARTSRETFTAASTYEGKREALPLATVTQVLFNSPTWEGVFWFDVLRRRVVARNAPFPLTLEKGSQSKGDLASIRHWFDCQGKSVTAETIQDALERIGREPSRQLNEVASYLDSVAHLAPGASDVRLIDTLATDLLGAESPLANVLVRKTLIAAVRRGRNPGIEHPAMLVLEGAQDLGKTSFAQILGGPFYRSTQNGDLVDRDTKMACVGRWIVEVEELAAMSRADVEALKVAVSSTSDIITRKYEPDDQEYLRSFVMIGTTNRPDFLPDDTGNRRFWPVSVRKVVNRDWLIANRDRLWAEADYLAKTEHGMSHLLSAEEKKELSEVHEDHLERDAWQERVRGLLVQKWKAEAAKKKDKQPVRLASHEVSTHLGLDVAQQNKSTEMRIGRVLRNLGCKRITPKDKTTGKTVTLWEVLSDPAVDGEKPPVESPFAGVTTARVGVG